MATLPTRKMPLPNKQPTEKLDISVEFERLRTMYAEDTSTDKVNILLLGESGSGKTYLMNTAPGITHIDFFDKGGAKCVRTNVQKGKILADCRWEKEEPWNPTQFKAWEAEMERRIRIGYFSHIDNYVLDSATTWSMAIMNQILKNAGIPGQNPRFAHDYGPQKAAINNWINRLLNLPCNVIITGHLKAEKDEITGRVEKRFMTTGQGYIIIPLLFDEIWVMSPKATSASVKYRVLTQSTGTDLARSRLAEDGLLDQYEEPDLANILRKTGMLPVSK